LASEYDALLQRTSPHWRKTRAEWHSFAVTSEHCHNGLLLDQFSTMKMKRSTMRTAWSSASPPLSRAASAPKKSMRLLMIRIPHVDHKLLAFPATSFHPKSSDDSMLHENVET
jgi:hypothetical protein